MKGKYMKLFSKWIIIVLVFACAFSFIGATGRSPYSDAEQAAWELYNLGLFIGIGNDEQGKPVFELDRTLTRNEAITLLVRLLGREEEALSSKWTIPFSDVDEWAVPYVGYAYSNGLTNGTSASTFSGNQDVSATQYLTFILRALGYASGIDYEWDKAWILTDQLNITHGEYSSGRSFTRGDAVIVSRNALYTKLKGQNLTLIDAYHLGQPKDGDFRFEIHYIDVGQGDAALILCDGHAMLVDGGTAENSSKIYSYLQSHGVSHLDYIMCSHPHQDHIGGLSGALNYASVGTVYCPVADYDSEGFTYFKKYLDKQGVSITVPKPGDTFSLGNATAYIYGPLQEWDDLNMESIIFRIQYGGASFLFTGDAKRENEQELIEAGYDLHSTVLKVGHHGSATSTSYPFLYYVEPKYAVISVGKDNGYGHPSEDTLSRLRDSDVIVYRTDECGTIICKSDGQHLFFETEKGEWGEPSVDPDAHSLPEGTKYVLNTNSHKFHRPECSSVEKMSEKNKAYYSGTREELIAMGFDPCGVCNP